MQKKKDDEEDNEEDNLSIMSNDQNTYFNTTCITTYSAKVYLDKDQRLILIVFDLFIMICNILSNGLVAALIILTRQLKNTSHFLIFFLSVSDMLLGVSVQPMFAIMLYNYSVQTHCTFETVLQFFAILFTHTSAYCIAVIAFDRYCRMKYLNRYAEIMKKWITKMVFVFVFLFSFLQAILYICGTQLMFFHQAKKIAVAIDACIAISVVIVYVLTVRVVRNHRRDAASKDMLLAVDRVITNVAAKILLAVVIFYIPYIITSGLYAKFDGKVNGEVQRWLSFTVFIGFLLTYCNTIANALVFLTLNRKAKQKMMERNNK